MGHVEHGRRIRLRIRGLTKRFPGVVANDDVSLDVHAGEIHALLGENGAGKSTLMNMVYGLMKPDSGTIEVDGQEVSIGNPRQALARGIGLLPQHFTLVPTMTVAQNVALSEAGGRARRARLGEVAQKVEAFAESVGFPIPTGDVVENLSVGMQQRVEIIKLLYHGADVLALDEPTATLSPLEWDQLAVTLRRLAREGRSIILITHKLQEALEVADRCTVLRKGRVVGTVTASETTEDELAEMMVGREVDLRWHRPRVEPGDVVLDVKNLGVTAGERRLVSNVSFDIRAGEILGVAGVEGNGQRELVDVLTGMVRPAAGEIWVSGKRMYDLTPEGMTQGGTATIPEDRQRSGLTSELSVFDNLMVKDFRHAPFARFGVMNIRVARAHAEKLIETYDIRVASVRTAAGNVSGGNQQKIIIARELARHPALLIAAQPTRGLDIGAINFVYRELSEYTRSGGAVLLVSSELDELLSLSDRIAVMTDGTLRGILDPRAATPEQLGSLMLTRSVV